MHPKIVDFPVANNGNSKMSWFVPNENADLLRKFGLMVT